MSPMWKQLREFFNPTVVVGLDLSLTSTGVSYNGETYTIQSPYKGVERLSDIRDGVASVIIRSHADIVAIEGYSFASRNSHAHALGELGGVIRLQMYEMRRPVIEIPPTTRAKFATGKGNAGKSEVVSAISARTGIVWNGSGGDDRCDAWILEEMVRTRLGLPKYDWPAVSLSALDNIDWSPIEK